MVETVEQEFEKEAPLIKLEDAALKVNTASVVTSQSALALVEQH